MLPAALVPRRRRRTRRLSIDPTRRLGAQALARPGRRRKRGARPRAPGSAAAGRRQLTATRADRVRPRTRRGWWSRRWPSASLSVRTGMAGKYMCAFCGAGGVVMRVVTRFRHGEVMSEEILKEVLSLLDEVRAWTVARSHSPQTCPCWRSARARFDGGDRRHPGDRARFGIECGSTRSMAIFATVGTVVEFVTR